MYNIKYITRGGYDDGRYVKKRNRFIVRGMKKKKNARTVVDDECIARENMLRADRNRR